MTKTLTEQWRDGTMEEGFYYILFASRFGEDYIAIDMFISEEKDFMYSSCEDVKEVLAPVPSYDEWKQAKENLDKNGTWYTERSYKLLEKKLEIATKALKEYAEDYFISEGGGMYVNPNPNIARKALKEMEGVK